jgi:hypothetical protein
VDVMFLVIHTTYLPDELFSRILQIAPLRKSLVLITLKLMDLTCTFSVNENIYGSTVCSCDFLDFITMIMEGAVSRRHHVWRRTSKGKVRS